MVKIGFGQFWHKTVEIQSCKHFWNGCVALQSHNKPFCTRLKSLEDLIRKECLSQVVGWMSIKNTYEATGAPNQALNIFCIVTPCVGVQKVLAKGQSNVRQIDVPSRGNRHICSGEYSMNGAVPCIQEIVWRRSSSEGHIVILCQETICQATMFFLKSNVLPVCSPFVSSSWTCIGITIWGAGACCCWFWYIWNGGRKVSCWGGAGASARVQT